MMIIKNLRRPLDGRIHLIGDVGVIQINFDPFVSNHLEWDDNSYIGKNAHCDLIKYPCNSGICYLVDGVLEIKESMEKKMIDIIKSFLVSAAIFYVSSFPYLLVKWTDNRHWFLLYLIVPFIILWIGIYFEITKNY